AAGLAQADAVDDGGVGQLVGEDRGLVAEGGLEQPAVGVPAGRVEDGGLLLQEGGDGRLQLVWQVLGAAGEADAGDTGTIAFQAVLCGGDDGGVVGQSEVVVGAEVEDVPGGDSDVGALGRLDLAFLFVQALAAQVVELPAQDLKQMRVAHGWDSASRCDG